MEVALHPPPCSLGSFDQPGARLGRLAEPGERFHAQAFVAERNLGRRTEPLPSAQNVTLRREQTGEPVRRSAPLEVERESRDTAAHEERPDHSPGKPAGQQEQRDGAHSEQPLVADADRRLCRPPANLGSKRGLRCSGKPGRPQCRSVQPALHRRAGTHEHDGERAREQPERELRGQQQVRDPHDEPKALVGQHRPESAVAPAREVAERVTDERACRRRPHYAHGSHGNEASTDKSRDPSRSDRRRQHERGQEHGQQWRDHRRRRSHAWRPCLPAEH